MKIDPIRKPRMIFEDRPHPIERRCRDIAAENDDVGIPHRHQSQLWFQSTGHCVIWIDAECERVERMRDHLPGRLDAGDLGRNRCDRETRGAHVDPDRLDLFGRPPDPGQGSDAPAGLDSQRLCVGDPTIDEKFRDASDSISAHLTVTAVRIEHSHPSVVGRILWGVNDDQSIGADATMPITHQTTDRGWIRDPIVATVDKQVVVSDSVHLDEVHAVIVPRS
jgi:hypothetical protein